MKLTKGGWFENKKRATHYMHCTGSPNVTAHPNAQSGRPEPDPHIFMHVRALRAHDGLVTVTDSRLYSNERILMRRWFQVFD
jgi:hypothetical protein